MIDLAAHKKIHCVGIGGIGLSAIAEILLSRGYQVSGSDMKDSNILHKLQEIGATIYIGHRPSQVRGADLVIYTAALPDDNPELVEARKEHIPTATRAEVLGTLMDEYRNSVAVSGTHGKTTTTSMVSLILSRAGLDPTVLVGGNLNEIHGNYRVGASEYFVAEACEYKDSFLHLRPRVEIILNIDRDHLDYFKNLENIVRSFTHFVSNAKADGFVVAVDDNDYVTSVVKDLPAVFRYGYGADSDYRIKDPGTTEEGLPFFTICYGDGEEEKISLQVPGDHNILNAAAAFCCCRELGVEADVIRASLQAYRGTARRFDRAGMTAKGAQVIDDYAHHPTEIRATLRAASALPHRKIWCVFQPHTFKRTLALFDDFVQAFDRADAVILTDIYAGRDKDEHKVHARDIVKAMKEKYPGKDIRYQPTFLAIAEALQREAKEGDLILTMGAGNVNELDSLLVEE